MDLSRQYSTIGINGINEAIEELGLSILEPEGQVFVNKILNKINEVNSKAEKQYKAPHNQEQTPSENSAIKLAEKDRVLGLQNKYQIYSNQFIPLTTQADLLDRIKLQGMFDKSMSGGAICHLNIEQQIKDPQKEVSLLKHSVEKGVVYMAVNHILLECENGHMTVGKSDNCSICNGKIINKYTRVVGFLTPMRNWSFVRRTIEGPNRVFY
jgi:ribonucleoside-triphosphate reductase